MARNCTAFHNFLCARLNRTKRQERSGIRAGGVRDDLDDLSVGQPRGARFGEIHLALASLVLVFLCLNFILPDRRT
jgi:hypothetical protein